MWRHQWQLASCTVMHRLHLGLDRGSLHIATICCISQSAVPDTASQNVPFSSTRKLNSRSDVLTSDVEKFKVSPTACQKNTEAPIKCRRHSVTLTSLGPAHYLAKSVHRKKTLQERRRCQALAIPLASDTDGVHY